MVEIHNLIQPGLEQIFLPALSTFFRSHPDIRCCFATSIESRRQRQINLQANLCPSRQNWQKRILTASENRFPLKRLRVLHGRLSGQSAKAVRFTSSADLRANNIGPSPGTIPLLIDWEQSRGDKAMSDEAPPLVYDGLDPAPEPKPTIEKVSEAVKDTAQRVSSAIDAGRKPGMPLSILSNIAREAPLGSLLVAFLLGVLVARRR